MTIVLPAHQYLPPPPPPPPPPPAPFVQDFEGGSLYGLEKFWAFHHYTGFPKDQPNLEMLPKVRAGADPLVSVY